MCIKATIVAHAFLVKYFKNTAIRAYVGLRVKLHEIFNIYLLDGWPYMYYELVMH